MCYDSACLLLLCANATACKGIHRKGQEVWVELVYKNQAHIPTRRNSSSWNTATRIFGWLRLREYLGASQMCGVSAAGSPAVEVNTALYGNLENAQSFLEIRAHVHSLLLMLMMMLFLVFWRWNVHELKWLRNAQLAGCLEHDSGMKGCFFFLWSHRCDLRILISSKSSGSYQAV